MKYRRISGARSAFTIVELLVAMALIIFIMYILAEAFAAGTSAFRNLKAIGDMNERLRSTNTVLRRYLQADHFEGRKRLSDVDFWKNGPPQEGCFRIIQSGPSVPEGFDLDGLLSSGSSLQALHLTVKLRGNNRADYFRSAVPPNIVGPPSFVSPLLTLPFSDSRFQEPNSNVFCSPAAEVVIYMVDSGIKTEDVDSGTNAPQRLFTLCLRQRSLVPDNSAVPTALYNPPPPPPLPTWRDYLEISATQDPSDATKLNFNNLQDVTMPGRRWGKFTVNPATGLINAGCLPDTTSTSPTNLIGVGQPIATNTGGVFVANPVYPTLGDENGNLAGNDVLLTDVLSCNFSVLIDSSSPKNAYNFFTPSTAPPATVPGTTAQSVDFVEISSDLLTPFMAAPSLTFPRIFDTWSNRKDEVFDYSNSNIPMFRYNHPTVPNHPLNGTLIQIRAIKITLRIWDSRTKQTRQSSIVVDM